ncbi:hypothetical protein PLANPX_0647 [Lacipirellula parvula]|uniref:Uncharacterized protein n=1 Tax=Lacipirellula parvula TaxID=2650471 RepID=A0A5K7X3U5_9BACT|nr:hypothetical protein PLANPX_0647 [Lacipirellula parvula]
MSRGQSVALAPTLGRGPRPIDQRIVGRVSGSRQRQEAYGIDAALLLVGFGNTDTLAFVRWR